MVSKKTTKQRVAAKPRTPRAARKKKTIGAGEIAQTNRQLAPQLVPAWLATTLSPVDLPEPPVPLPHPLRWTSIAIATATLSLALLNAHALRGWSYQLPPSDQTAQIVTLTEVWYDIADRAGLNRPFEAMHAWWQSAKDARFGEPVAPADMAAADARRPPTRWAQR